MGSTEIVNRTSRAMNMRIGNCRHFIKLATVAKNRSYKMHVDYSDTYVEYSLGPDSSGKPVIVTSDECVDNRKIIVREDVDGRFQVEKQPRVRPADSSTATSTTTKQSECETAKRRRPSTLWRLTASHSFTQIAHCQGTGLSGITTRAANREMYQMAQVFQLVGETGMGIYPGIGGQSPRVRSMETSSTVSYLLKWRVEVKLAKFNALDYGPETVR